MDKNEKLEKYSFQELENLYVKQSVFMYDEFDESLELEKNRRSQYERDIAKNFHDRAFDMDPHCYGTIPLRFLGNNLVPLDVAVLLSIVSSLGTEIQIDEDKYNVFIANKKIWDDRFECDIRLVLRKLWALSSNSKFCCKYSNEKILFAIPIEGEESV